MDIPRIPQGRGDLGRRMIRALKATFGPTLLIGSDIPGVTRTHIVCAFAALGDTKCVIGPATDGGFWLIGLKHPRAVSNRLFQDTRWSHPDTLKDALQTLPPTARAGTLSDVDTAADLSR